jgi:DNA polymerase-3 subunit gamma/tau
VRGKKQKVSKALYRKYRSKTLADIVGQGHVTDILSRSLAQGIIAHAYLLTGPRGTGKTSIARILAHEINQLPYNEETPHLDIIEIDAASNNGVEDVRELRDKVQIAPVSADKKVYIIDEVHMLSKAAFNALLKTLEEPPEHAVFILATTDSDKLPATIISRTQRFNFRAIAPPDAAKHLRFIADSEKINIDDTALELIALRGDGSFRDSISLLDQLQSTADKKTGITRALVEQMLGLAPTELVQQLLDAYEAKDLQTLVRLLDESEQSGVQSTVLASQLIQSIRSKLAEKPAFIPLLDQLLDVAKSSRPNIKLLTIMAAYAAPKPKTAALQASVAEISVPIAELEKQAVQQKPAMSTPAASPASSLSNDGLSQTDSQLPVEPQVASGGAAPDSANVIIRESGADQTTGPASAKTNVPKGDQKIDESKGEQTKKSAAITPTITLDWKKLIEHTRANYVAVYSLLEKCDYELQDGTLALYTRNAFYKKRLDDTKHRINLLKAMSEINAPTLTIETIGTPPPPKDSQAAAVAAIMGGGEEVSVG